jgi:hypothetical protein
MPSYAGVYLDAAASTYIPLPCIAEWERKPTAKFGVVHLSTAGEAYRLNYKLDEACWGRGDLSGTSHTFSVSWLMDAGFLPATMEWWDRPYRTESGVVHPKRT